MPGRGRIPAPGTVRCRDDGRLPSPHKAAAGRAGVSPGRRRGRSRAKQNRRQPPMKITTIIVASARGPASTGDRRRARGILYRDHRHSRYDVERAAHRSWWVSNPLDRERAWSDHAGTWTKGLAPALRSGIDVALWDLSAKITGRPLFRHLGGFRDRVPVCRASTAGGTTAATGDPSGDADPSGPGDRQGSERRAAGRIQSLPIRHLSIWRVGGCKRPRPPGARGACGRGTGFPADPRRPGPVRGRRGHTVSAMRSTRRTISTSTGPVPETITPVGSR